MGLDFAIDLLYGTGWSGSDLLGCEHSPSGRVFPGLKRVEREFADAGYRLRVRHIAAFDCHRAEWADASGRAVGGVVGSSEAEAAVYALATLRRVSMGVGSAS